MKLIVDHPDPRATINEERIYCLCSCIKFFYDNNGPQVYRDAVHSDKPSDAFTNFAEKYYHEVVVNHKDPKNLNFDINDVTIPAASSKKTKKGKAAKSSPSSSLATWCKKWGLARLDENRYLSLTEIGYKFLNEEISAKELALISLSKLSIYDKDDNNKIVGSLLSIIAKISQTSTDIDHDKIVDTISKTYACSNLEIEFAKNNNEITLNSFVFCDLLKKDKAHNYLFIPENKDIWDDIFSNQKSLMPSTIKDYDENGKFDGGILNIITPQNYKIYNRLFPNICTHHTLDSLITDANQILYGCPGSGKTFYCQNNILDHYSEKDKFFITFHQAYSYEEFIEGLKPKISTNNTEQLKYIYDDGIFYQACNRACIKAGFRSLEDCLSYPQKETREKAFTDAVLNKKFVVICIDEINRANIAKVFGDLITLIETSKRLGAQNELIVTLPYSKRKFGVPANLKIIGTMNSSDRSVQLIDTALRRRFYFKEFLPRYDVSFKKKDAAIILKNINNKLRVLLNKDYQIGQAYLINATSYKDIFETIIYKIIPLLEEYFYNDIEKIRFVLNEENDDKSVFYKKDEDAQNLYDNISSGNDFRLEEKSFYYFNESLKTEIISDYKSKLKNLLTSI